MSEDRKIGDLPASDTELSNEERGSGAQGGGQPTPEATQPSPGGDAGRSAPPPIDPENAQRSSPPPPDPGNVRGTHPGEPYDPQ